MINNQGDQYIGILRYNFFASAECNERIFYLRYKGYLSDNARKNR